MERNSSGAREFLSFAFGRAPVVFRKSWILMPLRRAMFCFAGGRASKTQASWQASRENAGTLTEFCYVLLAFCWCIARGGRRSILCGHCDRQLAMAHDERPPRWESAARGEAEFRLANERDAVRYACILNRAERVKWQIRPLSFVRIGTLSRKRNFVLVRGRRRSRTSKRCVAPSYT